MLAEPQQQPFVGRSQKLGIKIDVFKVADAKD
jgi:hypothetical protein